MVHRIIIIKQRIAKLRKDNEIYKRRSAGFDCGDYGVAAVPGIAAAVRTAQLYFNNGRCPTAALVAAAGAVIVKLTHYSEKIYFN
jgi:hypothetical protein